MAAAGIGNVEFRREDLFALPFEPATFDHVFVCFVLEHLACPVAALEVLRGLFKASVPSLLRHPARMSAIGNRGVEPSVWD